METAVTLYRGSQAIESTENLVKRLDKPFERRNLRGGVVVEVTSKHQAEMAAHAGASCVLVTCRNSPDCVNRMPDPDLVREIRQSVSIPVMVAVRVGHFAEAQILESIGVDFIDESEVLSQADDNHFINKQKLSVPFVCGGRDLGEILRKVSEGAAVVRTQGDIKTSGDVVETVRNVRRVMAQLRVLTNKDSDELIAFSHEIQAPYRLVLETRHKARLTVPCFAAGGIFTPADAAMMRQLGCDGVFVELEVFDHFNPHRWIAAIVIAVNNYKNPVMIAEVTSGLVVEDSLQGGVVEPGEANDGDPVVEPREAGDGDREAEAADISDVD